MLAENKDIGSFSIDSLVIRDMQKEIMKSLHEGVYSFERMFDLDEDNRLILEDYFGKNITVHALVGKNGAGKSTLLDIMYRVINNLAFGLFVNTTSFKKKGCLGFIEGVNARINFRVKGQKCSVDNDFSRVTFSIEGKEYLLFDKDRLSDFSRQRRTLDDIRSIANYLFYTIVTNYSMQSLISSDYELATAYDYVGPNQSKLVNWVDNLFHKNDGYQVPIVLNPYRKNGVIDTGNECYLSRNRLVSILLFAHMRNKQLIDGYKFQAIEYKYNESHLLGKFLNKEELFDKQKVTNLIDRMRNCLLDEHYIANSIIDAYGLDVLKVINSRVLTIAYFYLVYKSLSIAGRYDTYSDYKEYGERNLCFEQLSVTFGVWEPFEILDFVNQIKQDQSHITLKIRQTLNFIFSFSTDDEAFKPLFFFSSGLDREVVKIEDILNQLRPPFYDCSILFQKGDDVMEYAQMSAGERQILSTICTHIYHVMNVLSVDEKEDRVCYRRFNLIFDETELCFHPDFQVVFVDRLIGLIQSLELNEKAAFNIILTTHSPFLLSDIPKWFILYIKDGRDCSQEIDLNPFCANVNAILKDSFLMENGFTGMFAQNRIRDLILFLQEKDYHGQWSLRKANSLIHAVGDPFLRKMLVSLYDSYISKHNENEYIQQRIDELAAELEQLKSKLHDEKNTD